VFALQVLSIVRSVTGWSATADCCRAQASANATAAQLNSGAVADNFETLK
jgi:hypothetical protein